MAEEGVRCRGRHSKSVEDTEVLMTSYVEDNISQGKGWIFDLGSTVHVCSQKELFNSFVAKKKGTIKMVDGSAGGLRHWDSQAYRKR